MELLGGVLLVVLLEQVAQRTVADLPLPEVVPQRVAGLPPVFARPRVRAPRRHVLAAVATPVVRVLVRVLPRAPLLGGAHEFAELKHLPHRALVRAFGARAPLAVAVAQLVRGVVRPVARPPFRAVARPFAALLVAGVAQFHVPVWAAGVLDGVLLQLLLAVPLLGV